MASCIRGFFGIIIEIKDIYEGSKSAYQDAVNVNDVSSRKDVMLQDYSTMIDKRNTAVLASSLTAGLWLFNAIDAALFFPAKYKGRRPSASVLRILRIKIMERKQNRYGFPNEKLFHFIFLLFLGSVRARTCS